MVTIFFDDLFEKVNETAFKSKHRLKIDDKVYETGTLIQANVEIEGIKISVLSDSMIKIKAGTLPLEVRGIERDA